MKFVKTIPVLLFLAASLSVAPVFAGGTNTIAGAVVYTFDFGTVNDSSGKGNDGTKFEGPLTSADVPFPAAYSNNNSILFTGSGATETNEPHVRIVDDHPAAPAENMVDISFGDITVEMWVKPNTARGMTLYHSADVRNFSQKSLSVLLAGGDDTGKIRLIFNDTTLEPPYEGFSASTNDVPVGQWTHVAAVLDRSGVHGTPSNAYIFVNGAQSGTPIDFSFGLGDIQNDGPPESYIMAIGAQFQGANYPVITTADAMDGLMDEFRVLRRALSPAEILGDSLNSIGPGLDPGQGPPPDIEAFTLVGGGPDTGFTITTVSNVNYVLQSTAAACSNMWRNASYTQHGDGNAAILYDSESFSLDNLYRVIALP